MRDRGEICNRIDFDAGSRDSADSCIATKSDALHIDVNTAKAVFFFGNFTCLLGSDTCGVSGALLGTAETVGTGRRLSENTAGLVGDANDGIVEGCVDMYLARGNDTLAFPSFSGFGLNHRSLSFNFFCHILLLSLCLTCCFWLRATNCDCFTLTSTCIRAGTLAVDW